MDPIVQAEWLAAVNDCGLPLDKLRLHEAPGDGLPDGRGAVYWSPDARDWPRADTPPALKPAIEELGGELGLHRIAIWRDLPQPVIGALLRHELEHARQWEAHGMGLFRLHDVIKVVLWRKVDSLPFGGLLINFAPIEIDANAAAAQFAWSRDPDAVNELLSRGGLGQHEPLFRYRAGPEPIATLPRRTVCFAHLFADLCERAARDENMAFREVLEARWSGAAELWDQLGALSLSGEGSTNGP